MAATNTWGAGAGWSVPSYMPGDTTTQDMTSGSAFGDYADYTYKPQDARQQIGSEYGFQSGGPAVTGVTPGLLSTPSNSSLAQEAGTAGNALSMAGGTAGYVGNAVGTIAGAYNNASTDTGSSVISGVASGAETGAMIGSVVPVVGTVFGAVVGGIIGGIAGFFGSKSKKAAEKKAFQQQEQLAVLPEQQRQANWLQQQGLTQKAISNYKSGYTPGGFQYKNSLLGNPGGATPSYNMPSNNPSLPNFNVAPPNAVPGKGDPSLGIAGNSVANNGINNSAGLGTTGFVAPTSGFQPPTTINAVAPAYSKDKNTNIANINAYAKNYQAMIDQQNQQSAANAMDPYKSFYGATS